MKTILAALAALALAACAAIPQPLVDAAKTSNDNYVENLKLLTCNMSISAVIRHPEMVAAVKSLCMPTAAQQADLPTVLPEKK